LTHPYSQFEGSDLWRVLERALTDLSANQDLTVTTAPEYVIGFFCRALASQSDESPRDLRLEARRLSRRLTSKVVRRVWRHSPSELGVQFTDGTQFFIDRVANGLDFSVVSGPPPALHSTRRPPATRSKAPRKATKPQSRPK
jgi:hypothetical protein